MPMRMVYRPSSLAAPRALSTSSVSWRSSFAMPSPPICCGSALASSWNRPSSVVKWLSWSFSIIFREPGAGAHALSMRNISCSAPIRRLPVSNLPSRSIRSSARRSARIACMNSRRLAPS